MILTNIIPTLDGYQVLRTKALLILLFTGSLIVAEAQILHPDLNQGIPEKGKIVSGRVSLDFMLRQDVSSFFQAGNEVDLQRIDEKSLWLYTQRFSWARANNQNLFNGGHAQFRRQPLPERAFGMEYYVQAQYDNVRGLKERFLGGGNIRYLHKNDTSLFQMGSGFFLEYENWALAETGMREVLRIKWNNYIRYSLTTKNGTRLSTAVFLQTRPDAEITKPRLSAQARIQFPLSERLAFSLQGDVSYDRAPVVPINPLTYRVLQKLIYSF